MTKLNLLSNSYRRIGQTVLLVGLLFCLLPGTAMHTQTSQKPTDVLSDYTVEFIRRKHDKPFLAYLAHKAVHGPFDDPPGRETLYADLAVKRSPNAQDSLEGKPVLQRTTLLELGGAKIPVDVHGRSLVPLFKADSKKWRSSFMAEYFAEPQFPRCPTWQAVRTERWKYVRYTELDGMDELYDLKNDPYELKNQINERGAQSTLEQMKKMLGDELQKTR